MTPQITNNISNEPVDERMDGSNDDFNAESLIEFLHLVRQLKTNKRTGWLNMGIPFEKTESIADHMYRMAIMVQLVQDVSINKAKCMKMALVHDLAEAITGDITPDDGISSEEKNRLETNAMLDIKKMLGPSPFGEEAEELWKEYAADSTHEANFVKDLDKLELIIQSVEYENDEGISFEKWISACKDKIRHPELKSMLSVVLKERKISTMPVNN